MNGFLGVVASIYQQSGAVSVCGLVKMNTYSVVYGRPVGTKKKKRGLGGFLFSLGFEGGRNATNLRVGRPGAGRPLEYGECKVMGGVSRLWETYLWVTEKRGVGVGVKICAWRCGRPTTGC